MVYEKIKIPPFTKGKKQLEKAGVGNYQLYVFMWNVQTKAYNTRKQSTYVTKMTRLHLLIGWSMSVSKFMPQESIWQMKRVWW